MSSAYVSPSRVVVLLPDPAARGRVFFEEQFYLLSHGNSNGCFLGFKPQRRNKAVGCARMWPKTADLDHCSLSLCHGTVSTSVSTQHGTWGCASMSAVHTDASTHLVRNVCAAGTPLPLAAPAPLASPPFLTLRSLRSPPCLVTASLHSCDGAILPIWLWRKQRPKDHPGQAWRVLASGQVLAYGRGRYYQGRVKGFHQGCAIGRANFETRKSWAAIGRANFEPRKSWASQ